MLRRSVASVAAVSLLICVSACKKKEESSADAGTSPKASAPARTRGVEPVLSGGPEVEKACYALGKARCAHLSACTNFESIDGTGISCLRRTVDRCTYEWAPKLGGITVADIDKCAAAQAKPSCSTRAPGDLSSCAAAPGTLADGKACTVNNQCASLFCSSKPNSCGKCAAAPKAGDACKDHCGSGLVCVDDKCVSRAAKGGDCTKAEGCQPELACVKGKCEPALAKNATCDAAADACDAALLLTCEPTTKRCTSTAVSKLGEICNDRKPCTAEATCHDGKCVERLSRGTACTAASVACDPPLACVAGSCAILDVATCPG